MAVRDFSNGTQALNVRNNINNGATINSQFNLATAGSNADFNLNIDAYFEATAQSKISVQFPSATSGASNARLSLDNGTTYANIVDSSLSNVTGEDIQNTFQTLSYNGTVWIVISATSDSVVPNPNLLINGGFRYNQRAVSGTVTLTSGQYGHDRFRGGSSGCTYTFSTTNNVTTITISAGTLEQEVEGLNIQSGTHILSWTGTAQGRIDGGSYGTSGVTATLTGGTNSTVEFNTGTITSAKFESGDVATTFVSKSYPEGLRDCQRYFWRGFGLGRGLPYHFTSFNTNLAFATPVIFPVEMRVAPTVTFTGATFENGQNAGFDITEIGAVHKMNNVGAGGVNNFRVHGATYSADAEL